MNAIVASFRRFDSLRIDRVWAAVAMLPAVLAVLDPSGTAALLEFAAGALLGTLPFIAFAVASVAFLKATGAEALVAGAFRGREIRAIVLAALVGGVAPFCSCEVIPFVAALLAVGAPLSAVMAFWLSSPLIDPPAFLITAGALGWPFAVGKATAAVAVGLLGGFAVGAVLRMGFFADPMRPRNAGGCCGSSPFSGKPVWAFWREARRRGTFVLEARSNLLFLLKWLALAYLLEGLLIAHVPAQSVAGLVGGEGIMPIAAAAAVGVPAYINGYAAPPLVAGLVGQGMTAGAAMAFLVAGAVTSVPAMMAVFALVRRGVFAAYVLLGLVGAVLSGIVFGAIL